MTRRPILVACLALAAGLLAYGVTRFVMRASVGAATETTEAQLDWLAREFGLDSAARAEIARIQASYEPVCENHCAAIAQAQASLRSAAPDPAARAVADAELARLKTVCAESTRAHLRSIAALMKPAQAERFLAMMEPRVAHRDDRDGAPALAPSESR